MLKVIIAGGRDFDNYELLRTKCDKALADHSEIEIVCGMARGADSLGDKYAKEKGFDVKYFEPDWDRFGKSAGYKRNEEMAVYGDVAIVFWDGVSKGSKHMIDLAKLHKLKLKVYGYK